MKRGYVNSTLHDMRRSGYVGITGAYGEFGFYLTGKVGQVRLPPDQRKERDRIKQKARRHAKGMLSWEQYNAKRRAEGEALRAAKREVARAESEKRRAERRAATAAKLTEKRKVQRVARVRRIVANENRHVSIAPVSVPEALPSVEAWLAQGGKVEKLEIGAVSKPFRAIGFNNRRAA